MTEPVKPRRRGAALEDAVLDAAWVEIAEHGYAAFTVDGVATRAGTSKAVLYRRWPDRAELARAAIARFLRRDPVVAPETGSLRGDVIALLQQANERRVGIGTALVARVSEFQGATGTTIADLRDAAGLGHDDLMAQIIERGIERGEVDPAKATERIVRLPSDLFRLELLATFRPVSEEDIIEIVDTIFLPLISP